MTLITKNPSGTPCVDAIYKERNRLKNEQNQIQDNIKKTINNTEEQIRKLKNKIEVLENKKKALIIEFNKECDKDERIRGTTPPQIKISPPSSPNPRIINRSYTDINDVKKQLNNDRLMKMIENAMNDKINKLQNTIELKDKERQLEDEKRQNNSSICCTM